MSALTIFEFGNMLKENSKREIQTTVVFEQKQIKVKWIEDVLGAFTNRLKFGKSVYDNVI